MSRSDPVNIPLGSAPTSGKQYEPSARDSETGTTGVKRPETYDIMGLPEAAVYNRFSVNQDVTCGLGGNRFRTIVISVLHFAAGVLAVAGLLVWAITIPEAKHQHDKLLRTFNETSEDLDIQDNLFEFYVAQVVILSVFFCLAWVMSVVAVITAWRLSSVLTRADVTGEARSLDSQLEHWGHGCVGSIMRDMTVRRMWYGATVALLFLALIDLASLAGYTGFMYCDTYLIREAAEHAPGDTAAPALTARATSCNTSCFNVRYFRTLIDDDEQGEPQACLCDPGLIEQVAQHSDDAMRYLGSAYSGIALMVVGCLIWLVRMPAESVHLLRVEQLLAAHAHYQAEVQDIWSSFRYQLRREHLQREVSDASQRHKAEYEEKHPNRQR